MSWLTEPFDSPLEQACEETEQSLNEMNWTLWTIATGTFVILN